MNAPIVHIQYDQVRQVAQRLQRQREAVQTLHQRILRTYQQLTQGAWEGAAATRWAAEMQAEVFPAFVRAVHVLGVAQTVALDMVATFDAAEHEAARLFQGELHAVAVGGFSGGNAAGNGGLRQSETPSMDSTTTFVSFTPTPEPITIPIPDAAVTPQAQTREGQERQALIATITQLLTDRGIPATPNGNDYGISTLPLDAMTLADLTQLHAMLSSDNPQLLIEDSFGLMNDLQTFWGYDTITMVQALRELYYGTTIDPFIAGAGAINESILAFTPNLADPTGTSQAAYAYTLFQLSRQRTGYVPALVPITRNDVDIGLDHVIVSRPVFF